MAAADGSHGWPTDRRDRSERPDPGRSRRPGTDRRNSSRSAVQEGRAAGALDVTAGGDEDEGGGDFGGAGGGSGDDLYDRAVAVVTRDGKASTSYVQRRLQIGYNRAASLIERMEQEGVVSPANHAGKREILVGAPP